MTEQIIVTLSKQDLAEFLENNEAYMEAYVKELERRLFQHFNKLIETTVEVSTNALSDTFYSSVEDDSHISEIHNMMNEMVNDWSWLDYQTGDEIFVRSNAELQCLVRVAKEHWHFDKDADPDGKVIKGLSKIASLDFADKEIQDVFQKSNFPKAFDKWDALEDWAIRLA